MTKDETLKLALEALEDSVDTVRREYETDWRHGLPTRKAQLDGMKQAVDKHEAAITAIQEALAQPAQRKPWVGLTEQEHTDIAIQCGCMSADWGFYGATVERILKEKNS